MKHAFSVVVCTRNRVRFLERALDSLLAQEYPRDRYEVIIVDNDSSDGTRSLVERYMASPVPLSYRLESRPGVSFARNTGAASARHDYVAFLDDDTIAARQWLDAYDAAIRSHGVVAAGGPVEPVLETGVRPPAWWSDHSIRSIFGLDHADSHPGQPVFEIRWPLWLGGCNALYSRTVLHDHGGFHTGCGPVGDRYRVAEDIDLNVRLERAGVPIHYVRDASIQHRITADRLNRRFLCRRAYSAGITDAAARAMLGGRSPACPLPQLARAALRLLLSPEPARTPAACRLAYSLGRLRQRG